MLAGTRRAHPAPVWPAARAPYGGGPRRCDLPWGIPTHEHPRQSGHLRATRTSAKAAGALAIWPGWGTRSRKSGSRRLLPPTGARYTYLGPPPSPPTAARYTYLRHRRLEGASQAARMLTGTRNLKGGVRPD